MVNIVEPWYVECIREALPIVAFVFCMYVLSFRV